MTALIDTSVLIGADPRAAAELDQDWAVSAVTVGELEAGVLMAEDPSARAARLRRLTAILGSSPVIAVDRGVAARYGELRAATGRLPSNDLWIAATAAVNGLTLITADERQGALPLPSTTVLR